METSNFDVKNIKYSIFAFFMKLNSAPSASRCVTSMMNGLEMSQDLTDPLLSDL